MSGMDDRIRNTEASGVSIQAGMPLHGRAKLVQVKTVLKNGQLLFKA